MSTTDQVQAILRAAAARYDAALKTFNPWISTYPGNNVVAERNVSFYIAREFCDAQKEGHVFMEREFRFVENGASLKLDTYCTSPELAMMVEVKVLVDLPYASNVADDFDRVCHEVAEQQANLHTSAKPQSTHGVVLIETWKDAARRWWLEKKPTNSIPPQATSRLESAQREGWHFGEVPVGSYTHGSRAAAAGQRCYWLFAISPPFANAA